MVITDSGDIKHKPHPDSLERARQKLGVPKTRTLMLGDSDKDLGAAQNDGLHSLLFYPPANEQFYDLATLQAFQPTYVIRSWQELITQF